MSSLVSLGTRDELVLDLFQQAHQYLDSCVVGRGFLTSSPWAKETQKSAELPTKRCTKRETHLCQGPKASLSDDGTKVYEDCEERASAPLQSGVERSSSPSCPPSSSGLLCTTKPYPFAAVQARQLHLCSPTRSWYLQLKNLQTPCRIWP